MCASCGCDSAGLLAAGTGHHHHDHDHDHDHRHDHGRLLRLEQDLLAKNDGIAVVNRRWLADRRIVALNLLSGPGSGKTTLLERTIRRLAPRSVSVLEGDQDTDRDAERIRTAGARAVQINTGTGCHLDATMVSAALDLLGPAPGSLLFLENVGNLVCPSLFDLGERAKVVLLSVTEGEDKPIKYPHAFRSASVLVLTKIDLLAHLEFNLDRCLRWARQVNPRLRIFTLSALRGDGMDAWCDWLVGNLDQTATT
jgi:hydrogenase nickel incorporation protein HypB